MVTTSAGGMPPKFTPQSEFIDTNPKMGFFKEMNLLKTSGISGGWKTSKGLEFRPNSLVLPRCFYRVHLQSIRLSCLYST